MKLFDTHAHLNFEGFSGTAEEVIKRSFASGMEGIVNIGTRYDNSELALAQAKKYEKLYAAIGFHPDHLKEVKDEDIPEMMKKFSILAKDPKVVAIGEIGFDNYYYKTGVNEDTEHNRAKEERIARLFMDLAQENDLPVIIHSRDAEKETFKLISEYAGNLKNKGVVHCFTGSVEFAENLLDLGFLIGFTGIITYPKSEALADVVKRIPLDKLVIETDSPFLAPQTMRGQKNEPLFVEEVAKKIAELKGVSIEEVAEATTENAKRLFLI
ncbi:TatD family hydrolase [bacterium]|nr:TatD family hydrolase [bacterium]